MVHSRKELAIQEESFDSQDSVDLSEELNDYELYKDELTMPRGLHHHIHHHHHHSFHHHAIHGESSSSKTKHHEPHEVFIEMHILSGHGESRIWKETGRWLKFEQAVEEGSDRFGNPHLTSLAFHYLVSLRFLFESGVCLVDLDETEFPNIAFRLVNELVAHELIRHEDKATMMNLLLLKHKHVEEPDSAWKFNIRRNTKERITYTPATNEPNQPKRYKLTERSGSWSTAHTFTVHEEQKRRNSATSRLISDPHVVIEKLADDRQNGPSTPTHKEPRKLSLSSIPEDIRWIQNTENVMKKLPTGAEGCLVLAGKETSLQKPILAFVRLADSAYMNVLEVKIPLRLLFVVLGPESPDIADYKEIGRAISALMSAKVTKD